MTDLCQQLDRSLRDVYAPVDTRQVWQWAEDEIVLSRRQTETPGPYSTLLTPYVREPLACFSDPRVTDLSMCFGTQTSKTTIVMIGAAWRMTNNPFPTLWVMPTENMARSFSENRWQPMVDDCSPLAALKPHNANRYKTLEQQFKDATLTFVGSNSPSNLASRPAGLLIMDETDKFAEATEKESSAVALAENRTKSYTNALRVKTSTPTSPGGEIWDSFMAGDQRYYFVPCPHCGEKQKLEFTQVKWNQEAKVGTKWDEDAVRLSAYYECVACKGQIHDGHKTRMLREGEWRPANPAASSNRRSYHLNSLYAPWRSCGFGELAIKFLRDKGSSATLQDFTNSTLALPWEERGSGVDDDDVLARRGKYLKGNCPIEEPAMVTLCADPGQDMTHWSAAAWSKDGQCHVFDYGTVLAPEALLEFESQRWETPSGKPVRVEVGLVDSGDFTNRIYELCARSKGMLLPSKGTAFSFGTWSVGTAKGYEPMQLYTYVDYQAKVALYLEKIHRRKAPFLWFPADADDEFLRGHMGQRIVIPKGGKRKEWRKVASDHFGDCTKLHVVSSWIVRALFDAAAPEDGRIQETT